MVILEVRMKLPFSPADLTKDAFVAQVGGVYEHSPWITEAAYDLGLPLNAMNVDALSNCLKKVIENAGEGPQLDLLRAHPDLAGRLAKSGELTADSTSEQASASLDHCTEAEFAEFTSLNARYKDSFGFPFILAVRGRNRQEILDNFRTRVGNSKDVEFRNALDQVHQIAHLRLTAMC